MCPKAAITTPFGLFKLLRMPSGWRTAAQTFQHFIDEVTRSLSFCFACNDDLLVASKNAETNVDEDADANVCSHKSI